MRILFIAHRLPFPPNKGDKIRAFNILRHLSENHEVHLAALIDDREDLAHVCEAQKIATSVWTAGIYQRSRFRSAAIAFATNKSISQTHFYDKKLQEEVDSLLQTSNFDLIYCSSSPTAEYVFRSSAIHANGDRPRLIMDLIDVDSVKWRQYADQARWPQSLVFSRESLRLARLERKIHSAFDHTVVVSSNEAQYFPGDAGAKPIVAISNGVDLDYFCPNPQSGVDPAPKLVFVGMMDYQPNIDGMQWFLDHVFPIVRNKIQNCRISIVGGKPTPQVMEWDSMAGVSVTGFVDDVRQFGYESAVCVVPLRIARGIQNKVLEAMGMGLPIVATPQAIDGIDVIVDEHVISTDDANKFAQAVVDLVEDRQLAERLGAAARRQVENIYSWEHQLKSLDELISGRSQYKREVPVHKTGSVSR